MNTTPETLDQLIRDLRTVVLDGEELLKATAGDAGEKAREAREKIRIAVQSARETCQGLEHGARDAARDAARSTDRAIREHPYETMGIAFGVGVLIGALVTRR